MRFHFGIARNYCFWGAARPRSWTPRQPQKTKQNARIWLLPIKQPKTEKRK